MERKEIIQYCMDKVKLINASSPDDRASLLDEFRDKLSVELEGVDYMEFKDGTITNCYLNFDSCCGLSFITASIDMNQFIKNMHRLKKENESNLNYAARLMCEICDRTEYWNDLIDEGSQTFNGSPEEIASLIVFVMNDWNGEEEFTEEVKEYLEGIK